MALKKLTLKPGVNRENTRYTNEGGWFESDKIRFRQGTPEKIGGWLRFSSAVFLGVCRSIFSWITLAGLKLFGVGTNLKFYIYRDEIYNDITPIRLRSGSATLTNPFDTLINTGTVTVHDIAHGALVGDFVTFDGSSDIGGIPALAINTVHTITVVIDADTYEFEVPLDLATSTASGVGGTVDATYAYHSTLLAVDPFSVTNGSTTVTVTDVANGALVDDFVTFSGATAVGGITVDGEYQITSLIGADTYTITAASAAVATATGGGSAVYATYQINTGPEYSAPTSGWGASYWGAYTWGSAIAGAGFAPRLWSQSNYGEALIFGPRYGGVYYWDPNWGVLTRGVNVAYITGASYVPIVQQQILVSDASRFVIAFGCNEIDSTTRDPMLIRWSDQENYLDWNPQATNQAGSLRLSNGSEIYTALQVRQEILVWTDSSLYSFQFLGAPDVWGATLLESNISCISPNGAAVAAGVSYWMGRDKFYKYDGRVETLNCDLRAYVFSDINQDQDFQVFAGSNSSFNEIWWFYCSANSNVVDRYVIFNYVENVWYYGTMGRTAWLDTGTNHYPTGATYSNNLVAHELGVDDGEGSTPQAIEASITSAQFDIDDGNNFSFIWRLLPDITFRGSDPTAVTPVVTFSLNPLANSGSGYTTPASVAGVSSAQVSRIGSYAVDQFTGVIYTRVRGRQISITIESSTLGTNWQLGSPRIDLRPDGRRQ